MDYRKTSATGYEISALSFGCMRFADDESAVNAIKRAVELGVNYFDVAPLYGVGTAERRLGLGLKEIDRSQVIVTAKSSPGTGGNEVQEHCDYEAGFGIRTADQVRNQIERSMTIMSVDHLDMYQFWAGHCDSIIDEGFKPGGFMDGVLKAQSEGLFDHIGLTTHADANSIIRYMQRYPFELVILPFHLMDTSRARAIEYCAERGTAVIAMNPLAGGGLARKSTVLNRIANDHGFESLTEAALRFVTTYPGVTSALCGMTYAYQVEEDAAAISSGSVSPESAASLQERLRELYANVKHYCTGCGYCGDCPEGILIPKVLEVYTDLQVPSTAGDALAEIADRMGNDATGYNPALCTACKACEAKCPNHLPISQLMASACENWPSKG